MIREPKRIQYVDPVYPYAARAAQVEGYVTIEARIGRDGTVIDPHVVKSLPMFDEAALAAVRQWLYSPTQLNGERVDVMATITVIFALK
jgi:protein TonB